MSTVAHVSVTATITDRHDNVETVWVGTQPEWAWPNKPWKAMMRKQLLAERTCDPQGWRVAFRAIPEDKVT